MMHLADVFPPFFLMKFFASVVPPLFLVVSLLSWLFPNFLACCPKLVKIGVCFFFEQSKVFLVAFLLCERVQDFRHFRPFPPVT